MKLITFNQLPLQRDELVFRYLDDIHVNDAIVIWNPADALILSPVFLRSAKSLSEHIDFINSNSIKKAIIIAEDIGFISQCPCLEYLWIIPAIDAVDFDYSPLYSLPNLKWLQCRTAYGIKEEKFVSIDYSCLKHLRRLLVEGKRGNINVYKAEELRTLILTNGYPSEESLCACLPYKNLVNLNISLSKLKTLNGIENAANIRRLVLEHNRMLEDISALAHAKDTLGYLHIDTCNRINDFSVLSELHNLEYLSLTGTNSIPNVSFLSNMPKLKELYLRMNISDGDLSLCKQIPYAALQNRRHYLLKDKDMSKITPNPPISVLYPREVL